MVIHSSIEVAERNSLTINQVDAPNGSSTHVREESTNLPAINEHGYEIREEPLGSKLKLRVIILGAGASGIDFFKNAEDKLENVEIQCYEKNYDIGGTVSGTSSNRGNNIDRCLVARKSLPWLCMRHTLCQLSI